MGNNLKGTSKPRIAYLDNMRSLVIIFVITIHAAVTYSGFGGWYYAEGSPEDLSIFGTVFFGLLQSFLQAWTMGILFFISACLAVKALAKRGSSGFIKERLFRLGAPLLLYVFIISPVISFIILGYYPENSFLENYIRFLKSFSWLGATGPLWFVEALLVFCIIYAALKKCFPKSIKVQNTGSRNIIFTILLTAIMAFLIRLVFPVGSSFMNLQFSYFASYIIMFIAGILVGENDLLDRLTGSKNIKWLKWSLIFGLPLWFVIMSFGGALEGQRYFDGGFYWQSFAFALWESLTVIGFSMGLMAFFRKKINVENKFTVLMRDNSFGIYFFHAPVLIIISLLLADLKLQPVLKFTAVLIIASVSSLLCSFLIRKIKPLGKLLK
ncbi:MAG: acyltransferase [Prevotellaceae bacterium]|jgi:surface polysaccharide O-acyltransferase-like enzyme|nr:acyltransferase [Prevotellaceae bacterium]